MDKNELKQFSVALRLVEGKDLGAALDIILPYVESHPYVPYSEDVKDIKENFRLMLHYMELGVEDDMRESMYNDMLDKLKGVFVILGPTIDAETLISIRMPIREPQ